MRAALTVLVAGALLSSGCGGSPPSTSPNGAPNRVLPSPSASAAAVTEFWTWFSTNAERLSDIQAKGIASEIGDRIKKINPGLTFEIGPRNGGGHTFAVSADGNTALFGLAQQVAAKAPPMKAWTVVAFRQRHAQLQPIKFGKATLLPQDVFYEAEREGARLVIHLYVKGMNDDNHDDLTGAAIMMVEGAVGEYDTFSALSLSEIDPLPEKKDKLHPVSELAAAVDAVKTTTP